MFSALDFSTDNFALRPLLRLQNETESQILSAQNIETAGFGGVIFCGSTPSTTLAGECRTRGLSVWVDLSNLPAPRIDLRKQQLVFEDFQPRFENGGDELDTLHPQSANVAIEILEALGESFTHVLFDDAHRNGSTPNPHFPWTDSLTSLFEKHCKSDLILHLSKLVSSGEDAALFRQQFWNTIHQAREENFLAPVRFWCNERHIQFCDRGFRTEYHALALEEKLRARLDSSKVAMENKPAFPAALSKTKCDFRELNELLHAGSYVFETVLSPDMSTAPQALRNEIIARHAALFGTSQPATKIGLLFPSRSCRTHYHPQGHRFTRWVGEDLQRITNLLDELHFDWLFVQEEQLAVASQAESTLRVGTQQHAMEFIVVPSVTALSWAVWEKLEAFIESGGKVACLGLLPQWSERGRDRELEARIGKTTRSVIADLYEAYAALEDETELPPTIGYPIFREYYSGGRLCCYQPRLNADSDDARLRVRQILHESTAPDFETQAPGIRYSHRVKSKNSLFFISNNSEQKQVVNARVHPTQTGLPVELNVASGTENSVFVVMPYSPEEGGGLGLQLELASSQSRLIAVQNSAGKVKAFPERATFEIETYDVETARGFMTQNGTPQIALRRAGKIEWFYGEKVTVPRPLLLDFDDWHRAPFDAGWEYSQSQTVPADWENCRVFLELATPEFPVQISVDNSIVELKIAPPFRYDISGFLKFGQNNLFSLKLWANEESTAPPVRLVAYPLVEVKITP